jgi:site-specific DNA-methyltransferase (adenine-specific)
MKLFHGDCLELMKNIADNSVDMVLTDPPYGTTACKWDSVIPFEPMWNDLKRITKDNGAICLFGSEPFSSHLRVSNLKMFKYDWIWDKVSISNPFMAKKQPLSNVENITVFYGSQCLYAPIMEVGKKWHRGGKELHRTGTKGEAVLINNGSDKTSLKYPKRILRFSNADKTKNSHPTQKPVALLEYLIKTYTLENETVLDFTMGSGSTGVACKNLNRKFIGIEKDDKYFEIAKQRIRDV